MYGREIDYRQFRDHAPDTAIGFDADGDPVLIEVFGGSSGSVDGTLGLVPMPQIGEQGYFLRAAGGWEKVFDAVANRIPKSDGLGNLVSSNLSESAGSLQLLRDGETAAGFFALADNVNGGRYGILTATTAKDRKMYDFVWVDTTASGGNADINLSVGNDMLVTVEFRVLGLKTDGSEGYSCLKVASFRKDGSALPVLVGAVATVFETEDAVTNVVVTTVSVTGAGLVRIAYTTGGVDVYRWTIYARVTTTQI